MDAVLELRNVCKTYEGFDLRDVSFALPHGYIMGLIGPNGAGKTTLIKMILNLVRPDSGDIRVFGLDAAEQGASVRARIGFVHEQPTFYEGLPAHRVATTVGPFYPAWDEAEFTALAREFGLPLRRKLKTYSHGMRTRFSLAMALAHGAELLLLDEPSSGLDPVFRRDILGRLSAIIAGGNTSVLFSSHLTSDLDRVADYITFLRDGRLEFTLTKDEVLERYALVKGDMSLLTAENRRLFAGIVTGEFGFVALTTNVEQARTALEGQAIVVDRATLEDVVYFTGRTGEGGLRLNGNTR
ncbi:MAG: ABC transporter ATP-binding protein [Gemmatimonadota bacterium]|nr:MAG: ABC transporter ATP-binding protein [Gemmatimonadota bacterium]